MMNIKVVCVFALAYLAVVAQSQSCPITQADVNALDLKPLKNACANVKNPPSADACDSCSAGLYKAFFPLYPKFGVTCENAPRDPSAAQSQITQALTPCINIISGPLQSNGVSLNSLLALRSCPNSVGPLTTSAINANCPGLVKQQG